MLLRHLHKGESLLCIIGGLYLLVLARCTARCIEALDGWRFEFFGKTDECYFDMGLYWGRELLGKSRSVWSSYAIWYCGELQRYEKRWMN